MIEQIPFHLHGPMTDGARIAEHFGWSPWIGIAFGVFAHLTEIAWNLVLMTMVLDWLREGRGQ